MGYTNFVDWAGYQRATVTSSFLDSSGSLLPTNANVTDDQTNLCLMADGYGSFATFPCLNSFAIAFATDVILCSCPLLCKFILHPIDN